MANLEFSLRPWQMSDLENLLHYANNFNVAKNLRDGFPHPYTKEHGENFIRMSSGNMPITVFAIVLDGAAVGGIGLHPQTDIYRLNAELVYWLGEPFWGKGIITFATKMIVDFGFKNLEIERIYAVPFGSNIGSQRVLEKAGFVLEYTIEQNLIKCNKLEDELIYAIRKKDWLSACHP